MLKFRKKPVVIEAMQFDGDLSHTLDIVRWAHRDMSPMANSILTMGADSTELYVRTLEGTMRAAVGDFIIRDAEGEFYPCKPDIFEATYDPVPHDA